MPNQTRVILLGSTGSIGVNTLDVIDHLNRTGHASLRVVGLAAGANATRLAEQAKAHGVERLALADPTDADQLPAEATRYVGADAAAKLVEDTEADVLVAAIVGAAGLPATVAGIEKGMAIALANKETLVAAGPLVMPMVQHHQTRILPLDSEHSGVHQCLQNHRTEQIRRVILTASGGPFRNATAEELQHATLEDALRHPTWSMGPKITIDSATMMNKAFEVIEAHHLFGLPAEKIGILVHPESVVHAFVEFNDGSVLSQLGAPDMRTPIQYALTGPERPRGCADRLDFNQLSQLNFQPPDAERFPAVKLAYDVLEAGGTAGAVANAANEAAVSAFLNRQIQFVRIVELVRDALSVVGVQPLTSLDDVYEADRKARAFVESMIAAETTSDSLTPNA